MSVNGKMTNNMAMERRAGTVAKLHILDNSLKAKSMVKVDSFGKMVAIMMETSLMVNLKVMASTFSLILTSTMKENLE